MIFLVGAGCCPVQVSAATFNRCRVSGVTEKDGTDNTENVSFNTVKTRFKHHLKLLLSVLLFFA